MITIGRVVHRLGRCPSTNDAAKTLAQEGAAEGTVLVAEEQTSGRGTKGRSWFSPPEKGLYVSIILRPEKSSLPLLPLAAGLACADAVRESTGAEIRLKWPNDLVWERKKLGGILCESSFSGEDLNYAVVGIGLNVNHEESDFPDSIRGTATSLRLIIHRGVDREDVLSALCLTLGLWCEKLGCGPPEEIVSRFQERMVFSPGARLTLTTAEGNIAGFYRGIDPKGGLILEHNGRNRPFYSAEVLTAEFE